MLLRRLGSPLYVGWLTVAGRKSPHQTLFFRYAAAKKSQGSSGVQRKLTMGLLAGLALVAALSQADANGRRQYAEPSAASGVVPRDEILTTLRNIGLDPIGRPVLRGPYYVLHAYDPSGTEMRVVADAQFGDVLSVDPTDIWSGWYDLYAPRYSRAPRIIHVPQSKDR